MGRGNQYSETYKRAAVAKAKESSNVSQTALELGISNKTLRAGSKQYAEPFDFATARELSWRNGTRTGKATGGA